MERQKPKTRLDEAAQRREAEIKDMIRRGLQRFAPALRGYRVFLFGSRVAGTARPRSDFDLAVDGEKELPIKTYYEIADMLEELPTLYRIDWVDMHRVSPEFRERAMRATEVLYE